MKVILNYRVIFILLTFSVTRLCAQNIVGPTEVNAGEVARYTFSAPDTYSPDGWESDGELLLDESGGRLSYMDVRWHTPGPRSIDINYTFINEDGYKDWDYVVLHVEVLYVEAPTPPTPVVQSNEGGTVTLAWAPGKTPPDDVSWYWQSTSNGTSTANSGSTINLTSDGTYYLRARNNETGTWSENAGSITFTVAPPPVWYYDSDGDGFGNTSPTKTSYNQPSGYVDNNLDLCPSEPGPYDGCLTENNENYVHTINYQKPYSESSLANAIPVTDRIETITYFDGLGRPMQNIDIRAGGDSENIITHIGYDDYGRQDKEYLPYASTTGGGRYREDALTATGNFYNVTKYENTTNPYSEKHLEASPLNRVLEQGAPGADWAVNKSSNADHTIKFDYKINKAGEVKKYEVDLTQSVVNNIVKYTPALVLNGSYEAGELYKTITKDENWTSGNDHTSEEFKDKQGRVVLKRTYNNGQKHDTYYVYDDYGNLTYVLPPKAEANTAKPDATELKELCYQYRYDERNRLVEKKIPGKGWEYIVYNKLDQPVMTQDTRLKNQNKWLFTKYDALGRIAYTGIKYSSGSRETFQHNADTNSSFTEFVEKTSTPISPIGIKLYYTNTAIPTTMDEIHIINYYDNYIFDKAGLTVPTEVFDQPVNARTKTLSTGSKVRVIGTDHWITTITGYDKKGRLIYTATKNPYLNTTDIVEHRLNFAGQILKTRTTHTKGNSSPTVTVDRFEYDHMGRLIRQSQCIGEDCGEGEPSGNNLTFSNALTETQHEVASSSITLKPGFHFKATGSISFSASISPAGELIAENVYDDLGQLEQKKVGNTQSKPLQTINYTYNVRGWLKAINNPDAALGEQLFAFGIRYNDPAYNPADRALYNGNISETYWRTANDDQRRNYRYTYDALNRITGATNTGAGEYTRYELKNVAYDKNGNITDLTRNGWQNSSNYDNMDVLDYRYNSTNKLLKVIDTGNKGYGFKDGTNTNNDYTYDGNGNLESDANKGITNITYNHLNLPTRISFGANKIDYIYDASGTKLKKTVTRGSSVTTTEYAGNYIYENGALAFFSHLEGYVTKENNSYKYVYQYKDHLGNVRLSYANTGNTSAPQLEIIEENNYYPFGLQHKGYNNVLNGPENNYKTYQGKEHQKELGLNWHDFEARNYMAEIGRWPSPDPLTEEFPEWSPYVFTYNNPIKWTDPTGMAPEDIVIRMLNEQGKSVEAFRIHTDLIETEVNLESNGLTYTGTETTNVYFDDKLTDYTEKLGSSEYLPDALSINASAEAAYKGGAQLEVSVLGILKGENKGDFGVTLQMNGLMGVEGGITGTLTGFYATQPNPDLDVFKGAEMGLQADVKAFGPASIAGAYHRGVEFQKPFDKNWNWRGFTKTTYEAISLGVSGGVVPLPVSFSGYLGVSDYIYRSDK